MSTAVLQLDAVRRAESAIASVAAAAERAAQAFRKEMELEDERSILKPIATRRIMEREKIAATPAEKLVETDEEYASLRRRQYDAVVEKQRALGCLESAKLSARLLVGLATVEAR